MTNYLQLPIVAASIFLASSVPGFAQQPDPVQHAPPTTAHANDLGPENGALAPAVGLWDVTETV